MSENIQLFIKVHGAKEWKFMDYYTEIPPAKRFVKRWKKKWEKDKFQIRTIKITNL